MRPLRVVLAAGLLAALSLIGPVAEGYIGQAPVQILMAGPSGRVSCGTTVTITATVLGAQDGKPIRQQVVSWGLTGALSASDRLSRSSSTTNRKGKATVDLQLGPYPGPRQVTASVTIVEAHTTVTGKCRLPETSLARPGDSADTTQADAPQAAVVPSSTSEAGQLAASISIPRLGISAPIVEGDGVNVPEAAVAHYPGTAWPGGGSNVYLYAHARTGLFGELWRVQMHELIDVTLATGAVVRYQVTDIVPVARADDMAYLRATDTEQLTLQTCLWYDDDSPRFIVIAHPLPESE